MIKREASSDSGNPVENPLAPKRFWRSVISAGILLLFGCLGAALILSVGSRLLIRKTEDSLLVSPHLTWTTWHRYDPDLMWALKANLKNEPQSYPFVKRIKPWTVSTNELGLRQPPIGEKGGRYRILCLGDSRTYGLGVNDDETYPAQLQAVLDALAPGKVEVVNAGVPGYSAFHGVKYLETRGFQLHPDMVLVAFGYNDASPLPPPGIGDWDWENPEKMNAFTALLRQAFRGAGLERRPLTGARETRLTPGEFIDSLMTLGKMCREKQVTPVFMAFPSLPEALGEYFERPQYAKFSLEAARLLEAPSIDLFSFLTENAEQIFLDDCHLNPFGNHVLAEYLAEKVERIKAGNSETLAPAEEMARYRKWINADPDCFQPYELLDARLRAANDPDARVQTWNELAERHPEAARARYLLGLSLESAGKFGEAASAYRRASELAPEDPAVWASLGGAMMREARHKEAIEAFRNASERAPQAVHLRSNLIEALCADKQLETAQEEAARCAREGITLPPEIQQLVNP